MLVACGGSKSPVVSRSTVDRYAESEKLGGRIITIIQSGDTWYGIAFANSLNVSELAAWNGMTENDKLRIGQRIRLTKPSGFQAESQFAASNSAVADGNTKVIQVRPSASSNTPPKAAQVERSRNIPSVEGAKTRAIVSQGSNNTNQVKIKPNTTRIQENTEFDQKTVRWNWPLRGKLAARFSPTTGRKGIDISGKQNQEIKVAAPGKVVYQGNGIKGYNNLIIIKHSEDLLSAYAHNQKVYVREGQWIKANQTISTVGLRNGKPLLHFEIRRNGKPVDPLRYLGKQ